MKTLKVLLQEVVSGIKAWVNSNFAQESNAVHKTGNETVNGDKTLTGTTTFSGSVACNQNCQFTKTVSPSEITGTSDCSFALNSLNNVVYFNTRGSSNYKGYGSFLWTGYNSDAAPDRYGQIQLLRSTDKYGDTNDGRVPDPTFKMWRVATYYNVMDFMESVRIQNINSTNFMIPLVNNATDLGTSTNRWKSFNGLNPGALSLPNVNAVTGSSNTELQDISGDLVQDQYFNCYFTPRMDGWAYIALNCSSATIRSGHSSYTVSVKTARSFANAIYTQSFTKNENAWSNLQIFIPVTANKEITLEYTFTGFSVTKAYVIPAQGNV